MNAKTDRERRISEETYQYMIRLVNAVRFHYRAEGGTYKQLDAIQAKHKELADLAYNSLTGEQPNAD